MAADIQEGLILVFAPFISLFLAVVAAGGIIGGIVNFFLDWFYQAQKNI
jgi:hypothetical protein